MGRSEHEDTWCGRLWQVMVSHHGVETMVWGLGNLPGPTHRKGVPHLGGLRAVRSLAPLDEPNVDVHRRRVEGVLLVCLSTDLRTHEEHRVKSAFGADLPFDLPHLSGGSRSSSALLTWRSRSSKREANAPTVVTPRFAPSSRAPELRGDAVCPNSWD